MSEIIDRLSYLVAMAPPPEAGIKPAQTSRFVWAVVTQPSPLRIRLEGDSTALPITPDSLVGPLQLDDRVWVQIVGRYIVVLGTKPRPPVKVTGSAVFTAAAGWSLGAADTTATVTRPAPAHLTILVGNINPIGAATLFNAGTVNVGWRPESEEPLAFKGSGTNKATASVAPDGVLWLQVMDACPAGYGWRFSGSWYLP